MVHFCKITNVHNDSFRYTYYFICRSRWFHYCMIFSKKSATWQAHIPHQYCRTEKCNIPFIFILSHQFSWIFYVSDIITLIELNSMSLDWLPHILRDNSPNYTTFFLQTINPLEWLTSFVNQLSSDGHLRWSLWKGLVQDIHRFEKCNYMFYKQNHNISNSVK